MSARSPPEPRPWAPDSALTPASLLRAQNSPRSGRCRVVRARRSGAAPDESGVPEPSVAPRACGGASVAATQPPAAFWPPEERRDIVAGQSSWEPAAGSRCEARSMASSLIGDRRHYRFPRRWLLDTAS